MIIELSDSDFILQSLNLSSPKISKKKCSVLLIKAEWCGFCSRFMPEYKELSKQYSNVNFFIIDSDKSQQLLQYWSNLANPVFEANKFPTVILYDANGNPMKEIDRTQIEQEIKPFL